MININALVEKYKTNSINSHNTSNFKIKKRYIDRNISILKKVFENNLEKDFFNILYNAKEPYVLADIAIDSFNFKYNLNKSKDIMLYIKKNAYDLNFSTDLKNNQNSQKYYANYDLSKIENEIKFYKEINDVYLYKQFYRYWDLLTSYYNYYVNNKNVECVCESIYKLLNDINCNDKIDCFIKITTNKFQSLEQYIYISLNYYFMWKIKKNSQYILKELKKIISLNTNDNPNLSSLILKFIGEINDACQLNYCNRFYPIFIRVAIFTGKSKTSKLYAVREFGYQCLLYSLDDVLRYMDVINVFQTDESDTIVERKEVRLFDKDAFREAVVNAFLHNRWVDKNEPMITVYSA